MAKYTKKGLKTPSGKLRWHLAPWDECEETVKVIEYGARKYAPDNWKPNVRENKDYYKSAIVRHLVSYFKGETRDPESRLHHLAHVACNAWFLMWAERYGE